MQLLEAIAQRVVSLISERIAAPRPEPVQSLAYDLKSPNEVPIRLTFTLKQLCSELSLSPDTIYKLENQGLIKSVPGVRRKIYSRAEVLRFLGSGKAKW